MGIDVLCYLRYNYFFVRGDMMIAYQELQAEQKAVQERFRQWFNTTLTELLQAPFVDRFCVYQSDVMVNGVSQCQIYHASFYGTNEADECYETTFTFKDPTIQEKSSNFADIIMSDDAFLKHDFFSPHHAKRIVFTLKNGELVRRNVTS